MDSLTQDRKERLEALPRWSWDPLTDQWEEGFRCLNEFVQREGHAKVAPHLKTINGFSIGGWVSNQRRTKESMTADRRERLEALPGWSWDALSDKWEEGFEYLKEFIVREGNSWVPRIYETENGFKLGIWVGNQRLKYARGKVSLERMQSLEALPNWVWRVK